MSRSVKRLKETIEEAASMIPDDGLILSRDEVNRLVYAVGGWQKLRGILYPEPTPDEIMTGPSPLSTAAIERAEEIRRQPRRPLPVEPLPIERKNDVDD